MINENFMNDLIFMSLNLQSLVANYINLTSFFDFLNKSSIQPDFLFFKNVVGKYLKMFLISLGIIYFIIQERVEMEAGWVVC
jgi:hypothetical protein